MHNFMVWKRGIERGIVTVFRERDWITALGALTGVFLLLQLIIFVLLGLGEIQSTLKSRTDLRLEIQDNAENQQIQTFLSEMDQLPYVEDLIFVTKEQAYAQMKKQDPELIAFLEEFELSNPFPETVAITLSSLDEYDTFDAFLKQEKWHSIVDPTFLSSTTDQEQYVHELLRLTNTGQSLGLFFLILTAGILLFVTMELVRGRVLRRSEEILVEHITGAETFAVLLPFAVEAIVLLLAAMVLSTAIMVGIVMLLPIVMPNLISDGPLNAIGTEMSLILTTKLTVVILIEVLAIPIIGWLGAWLGILPKISTRSLMLHRP